MSTPRTPIDPDAPVLVTGASGYIGSWIVRLLLEAGRTVHGTVRNPDKTTGLEHLHKLSSDHPGRLKLFKADLLEPSSFDDAMAGCELVMHTASPFLLSGFKDAQEALIRPALEGTRNVLNSVNRTDSVKRVVLTSSVVAIYGDAREILDVPGGSSPTSTGTPPAVSITSHTPFPRRWPSARRGNINRHRTVGTWSRSTRAWCSALR
ncbi:NAD-dependent epimerase/dehydratase family protein [Mycolicibacterium fortuitum]|nr:NAD-dependent epimerase/dehydratase family protein [Mycolicibacterium fortuitum]